MMNYRTLAFISQTSVRVVCVKTPGRVQHSGKEASCLVRLRALRQSVQTRSWP